LDWAKRTQGSDPVDNEFAVDVKADVPPSGGQPRLTKLGHWVLDDSSRTVESKR
jgi:hypothetical protein